MRQPPLGAPNSDTGDFWQKIMHVKMKELGGGRRMGIVYVDPPLQRSKSFFQFGESWI